MNLSTAKNVALSYIEASDREIIQWFRKDLKVDEKADLSPVTVADRNAEEILRKKISKAFPGHGIIGEEFGEENSSAEWVWTIDPIDGTRSFIRGIPLFSSLIALLHHGEPVMGVISFPALGQTAWAVQGKGAFCGKKRLRVSSRSKLEDAVVATADLYCFRKKKCMRLFERLSARAEMIRTYPDAFGHFMAISGSVDVMVDPLAYVWDYAPCKILAKESGGSFANFSGNKNSIREETAVVGNPKLVGQVRNLYKKIKGGKN